MPKGQQRSNKEKKKPKQQKPPVHVPSGFINKPPTRSNEPGKPQS